MIGSRGTDSGIHSATIGQQHSSNKLSSAFSSLLHSHKVQGNMKSATPGVLHSHEATINQQLATPSFISTDTPVPISNFLSKFRRRWITNSDGTPPKTEDRFIGFTLNTKAGLGTTRIGKTATKLTCCLLFLMQSLFSLFSDGPLLGYFPVMTGFSGGGSGLFCVIYSERDPTEMAVRPEMA